MDDYVVTMVVNVRVYATDREDAIKQAIRSHTNWDDWEYQPETATVKGPNDPDDNH